jgi:hypothetical protein
LVWLHAAKEAALCNVPQVIMETHLVLGLSTANPMVKLSLLSPTMQACVPNALWVNFKNPKTRNNACLVTLEPQQWVLVLLVPLTAFARLVIFKMEIMKTE